MSDFFFFLYNENVLPGSLFYFGSEAGSEKQGDMGEIIYAMLDVEVYSSDVFFEWCCQMSKRNKTKKNLLKPPWVSDWGYSQQELLWAWPDMSAPIPHCGTHHQSTMDKPPSSGGFNTSGGRGRQQCARISGWRLQQILRQAAIRASCSQIFRPFGRSGI